MKHILLMKRVKICFALMIYRMLYLILLRLLLTIALQSTVPQVIRRCWLVAYSNCFLLSDTNQFYLGSSDFCRIQLKYEHVF